MTETARTHAPAVRRLCLALLCLGALPCPGADPPTAPRYETRAVHDPDGIGKFYLGREIAQVMGHEGAGWLERPERAREEQPAKLLAALPLRPGAVVADIGAGTGYYTFRIAPLVGARGATGQVYAVDIQPEMLDFLRAKAAQLHVTNVVPVLGTLTDPNLPAGAVDLALLVDVYHEFSEPYAMMQGIQRALKPGGLAILVEYRGEDARVPIKPLHKMTVAQARKEIEAAGLKWKSTIESLPWQHIIVFRKE